jgi:uncharacterized protein (TIGR00251 family)
MRIVQTKDGLILELVVKPKSEKFRITVQDDEILVYCREEPERGKVNKELIKGFSKLFRAEVALVSGFTSKKKRLLIKNAETDETQRILLGLQS